MAVLVILGLIAIAAIPQFSDMPASARASAMRGLAGGIDTHARQGAAVFMLAGQDRSAATHWWCGWSGNPGCQWIYGFPSHVSLPWSMGLSTPPGSVIGWHSGDGGMAVKWTGPASPWGEQCAVSYRAPTAAGAAHSVNVYTTGC
jgi:hypothetical protein